jgi:hypothetical protein
MTRREAAEEIRTRGGQQCAAYTRKGDECYLAPTNGTRFCTMHQRRNKATMQQQANEEAL